MNATELADHMRKAYHAAPARDNSLHMTLFGIRYAQELDQFVAQDICELAAIGKWGPQVNLSKKLAQFVAMK